ncbi:hypothetical protein J6590_077681 [Homalodisca vitripennis]|nr:hypothetical protein J6590_077681 [Homalodisca vitripennis]
MSSSHIQTNVMEKLDSLGDKILQLKGKYTDNTKFAHSILDHIQNLKQDLEDNYHNLDRKIFFQIYDRICDLECELDKLLESTRLPQYYNNGKVKSYPEEKPHGTYRKYRPQTHDTVKPAIQNTPRKYTRHSYHETPPIEYVISDPTSSDSYEEIIFYDSTSTSSTSDAVVYIDDYYTTKKRRPIYHKYSKFPFDVRKSKHRPRIDSRVKYSEQPRKARPRKKFHSKQFKRKFSKKRNKSERKKPSSKRKTEQLDSSKPHSSKEPKKESEIYFVQVSPTSKTGTMNQGSNKEKYKISRLRRINSVDEPKHNWVDNYRTNSNPRMGAGSQTVYNYPNNFKGNGMKQWKYSNRSDSEASAESNYIKAKWNRYSNSYPGFQKHPHQQRKNNFQPVIVATTSNVSRSPFSHDEFNYENHIYPNKSKNEVLCSQSYFRIAEDETSSSSDTSVRNSKYEIVDSSLSGLPKDSAKSSSRSYIHNFSQNFPITVHSPQFNNEADVCHRLIKLKTPANEKELVENDLLKPKRIQSVEEENLKLKSNKFSEIHATDHSNNQIGSNNSLSYEKVQFLKNFKVLKSPFGEDLKEQPVYITTLPVNPSSLKNRFSLDQVSLQENTSMYAKISRQNINLPKNRLTSQNTFVNNLGSKEKKTTNSAKIHNAPETSILSERGKSNSKSNFEIQSVPFKINKNEIDVYEMNIRLSKMFSKKKLSKNLTKSQSRSSNVNRPSSDMGVSGRKSLTLKTSKKRQSRSSIKPMTLKKSPSKFSLKSLSNVVSKAKKKLQHKPTKERSLHTTSDSDIQSQTSDVGILGRKSITSKTSKKRQSRSSIKPMTLKKSPSKFSLRSLSNVVSKAKKKLQHKPAKERSLHTTSDSDVQSHTARQSKIQKKPSVIKRLFRSLSRKKSKTPSKNDKSSVVSTKSSIFSKNKDKIFKKSLSKDSSSEVVFPDVMPKSVSGYFQDDLSSSQEIFIKEHSIGPQLFNPKLSKQEDKENEKQKIKKDKTKGFSEYLQDERSSSHEIITKKHSPRQQEKQLFKPKTIKQRDKEIKKQKSTDSKTKSPPIKKFAPNAQDDLSHLNYSVHLSKEKRRCADMSSIPSTLSLGKILSSRCRNLFSVEETMFSEHKLNGLEMHGKLHELFVRPQLSKNSVNKRKVYSKNLTKNNNLNSKSQDVFVKMNSNSGWNRVEYCKQIPITRSVQVFSENSSYVDWKNVAREMKKCYVCN